MNKLGVLVLASVFLGATTSHAEDGGGSFFFQNRTEQGGFFQAQNNDEPQEENLNESYISNDSQEERSFFGTTSQPPLDYEDPDIPLPDYRPPEEVKMARAQQYVTEINKRREIEELMKKHDAELAEQYFIGQLMRQGNVSPSQQEMFKRQVASSKNRIQELLREEAEKRGELEELRRNASEMSKPVASDEFNRQYAPQEGGSFFNMRSQE